MPSIYHAWSKYPKYYDVAKYKWIEVEKLEVQDRFGKIIKTDLGKQIKMLPLDYPQTQQSCNAYIDKYIEHNYKQRPFYNTINCISNLLNTVDYAKKIK